MASFRFTSPGHDQPVDVVLERADPAHPRLFTAAVNERRFEVEVDPLGHAHGLARIAGRVYRYFLTRGNDRLRLWINGRTCELIPVSRTAQRAGASAGAAAAGTEVTAPMPGLILSIRVSEGDTFEAHQALIIMESMKMEMTLSVPHGGRVKELACQAGQLVDMGAILARIEPFPNSA